MSFYHILGQYSAQQWTDKVYGLIHNNTDYGCFFDTVVRNSKQKWSLLFHIPEQEKWHYPNRDSISYDSELNEFLQQKIGFTCQTQSEKRPYELPFDGGYVIYLAYEYAVQVEPTLTLPISSDIGQYPYVVIARCKAAFAYNHETQMVYAVTEEQSDSAQLQQDWQTVTAYTPTPLCIEEMRAEEPSVFKEQVDRILQHITTGDVFQVNLSRLWVAEKKGEDLLSLYQSLRQTNPSPMAAFWRFDADHTLMSSSPERLVMIQGDEINTRPIAGTRPRSNQSDEDKQLADTLLNHFKERAEHIMLIDLERNDLGRVAQVGSVEVNELMQLESYAHVHHIVSNVCAKIKPNTSPLDVLHATFPGGTITGCPKVQCMKIIAELEQCERGAYTGSIGYVNHDGSMDTNILIRTMMVQGDQIKFRAGAGIVFDSVPHNEVLETQHKAKGMMNALKALQSDTIV